MHQRRIGIWRCSTQSGGYLRIRCASALSLSTSSEWDLEPSGDAKSPAMRGDVSTLRGEARLPRESVPPGPLWDEFPGRHGFHFVIPVASDPTMGSARAGAHRVRQEEMRCPSTGSVLARR